MDILSESRRHLNTIGILPQVHRQSVEISARNPSVGSLFLANKSTDLHPKRSSARSFRLTLTNICASLFIILMMAPSIAYFIMNITDLAKTTSVFYLIGVLLIFLADYWILLFNKIDLEALLNELQSLVNQSSFFVLLFLSCLGN